MDTKNLSLDEIKNCCSEAEERMLMLYLNRKKQREIVEKLSEYNITRSKIDHFVAKYGLTRFRDRNNYCIDETKVSINNPEYWYFVGFFAADGNVHKTNSGSEIVQFTINDKEPLEDIKKLLNYSGTLKQYEKKNGKMWFLGITNKKLVNSLKEIFTEVYRKTSILKFPTIPNKDCLSMFLRGFWDGDGCFTSANNSRYYIAESYCDSTEFVNDFKQTLEKYNIKVNIFHDNKHFAINSKEDVGRFINLVYDYDSPIGLPRKRGLGLLHLYYLKHNR